MSRPPYRPQTVRLFSVLLILMVQFALRRLTGWWGWGAAGALAGAALLWPRLFFPLYRLAGAAGERLGRFLFACLAGLLYFLIMTPVAWIKRLGGRPFLAVGFEPERDSYFEPEDRSPGSGFEKQY